MNFTTVLCRASWRWQIELYYLELAGCGKFNCISLLLYHFGRLEVKNLTVLLEVEKITVLLEVGNLTVLLEAVRGPS